MIKRLLFLLLLISGSWVLKAQNNVLQGDILSDKGQPLVSATVVLLNPADSTMEFFGITNDKGHFQLKDLKFGKYLMHIAYLGYQTQYKPVTIPNPGGDDFGVVVMNPKPVNIKEVQVVGEYIPLQIKNDTIEFNAKAFKTRPDANVEELLKKLPGIEIDRSGNIKALGKDVRKVLVDGKEFFGNDPKVATKNLPADAIDKVQVYDKHSDESEFTGIDDGTRDKTVNLVLKDDMKKGIFGDVTAGGGTDNHYMGSGKAYKFTDKYQGALLGMMNNINQYGFSFGDMMSFGGGLSDVSGGGMRIALGGDNSFPLNFGSPVSGLTTSGAGGANFSYSWAKDSRVFLSYMGSGTNKKLTESTKSWNYTPAGSFYQESASNAIQRDTSHRINFGLRYRIDSTQNILLNGNVNFSAGFNPMNSQSSSYVNDALTNTLAMTSTGESGSWGGNASGSYMKKLNGNKSIFKVSGSFNGNSGNSSNRYVNTTSFASGLEQVASRYQTVRSSNINYSGTVSLSQKLGKRLYMEPQIEASGLQESYLKTLVIPNENDFIIDSLSPDFTKTYQSLKPELTFKRNTDKIQFSAGLGVELGRLSSSLWDRPVFSNDHFYLTPRISWEDEYKTGRRLSLFYQTRVNTPSLSQLLPVADNTNPLSVMSGNQYLEPEYSHDIFMHWLIFDQFSFTSLFTSLNAGITQNKINWSRTIDDNLAQKMTLINAGTAYQAGANIDFSTAVKKLGIKVNTSIRESFSRGMSWVNSIENVNTNLSHRLSLTIDNRKKVKWDANIGAAVTLTDAWYSLQESLNNRYVDFSWFGEVRFTPNDHWNFNVTADITNYTAESFDEPISIPLIGAQISYTFLKNNRGVLSLQGVDLLNKNTGIQRVSELNYLMERQSNIIGRYVMLSFKYRLNKFGSNQSAFDVKIHR
jgi:hypothetical protein